MTTSADAVEAHLARLDARACRAFVADLWAARGFQTRVDGEVVVATRHGASLALFPAVGGRLRSPSPPSRAIDVVVAPRGGDAAAALAESHDARLLTAADLGEMLRYAVDSGAAEALCERHLGAPPSALRLPLGARVRARVERLGASEPRLAVTAVVALLVLAAATGGFVGADRSSAGAFDGNDGSDPASDTSDGGAVPTDDPVAEGIATPDSRATTTVDDAGADVGSLSTVPGVDGEGVTNLTALATAHDRALGDRSYTLWIDTYRPLGGNPNASRGQRDTDIAVEGDRYLVHEHLNGPDGQRRLGAIYYDGTDWYVDDRSTGRPAIRWINGTAAEFSVQPDPRSLRETLVTRYLDTPVTDVTERVRVGDSTRYRLEGSGRPPGFAVDRVFNYSFVATVDEDGFVREATVGYTVATPDGRYRLRFEWTYGRVGTTTVSPPAWIEQARPETDAVSTHGTAETGR
ncbi:DUF7537 family lipoprotein [Salinigranum sp. GCM10025319]|uniref:DUF7537 family lipoprotein n=1 Tax=Salinigranum sp. GCM10025319 TaxID=3252687 RepID=UPI00360FBE5B